jgi:alkylmercury lyase
VYRAKGRKLYTWCAPDALLYPYVLDHTAEVRSTDPVSDERVELFVSSTGIEMVRPRSARVSWVRKGDPRNVRESFCRSSLFFTRAETAEDWAEGRDGVEILTVEEATRSIRMADRLM